MSRERFQVRSKAVQKMGRDGLVEQDRVTGEERRVSQKTADISFGPERAPEQQRTAEQTMPQTAPPSQNLVRTPSTKQKQSQIQRIVQELLQQKQFTAYAPESGFAPYAEMAAAMPYDTTEADIRINRIKRVEPLTSRVETIRQEMHEIHMESKRTRCSRFVDASETRSLF